MDADAYMDMRDDVHRLLDQLRVPLANADLGSADDQGTTDQPHDQRRVCVR